MTKGSVQNEQVEGQSSDWVTEMRAYERQNGMYRAEDLQRVLGDPRKGVGLPALTDLPAAMFGIRK